jgi:Fe-S cluster assembly protein SufB
MSEKQKQLENIELGVSENDYKYGFNDGDIGIFKTGRGLTEEIVREISRQKQEPAWMLDFRLEALDIFHRKPMPTWGADLSGINFDDIH